MRDLSLLAIVLAAELLFVGWKGSSLRLYIAKFQRAYVADVFLSLVGIIGFSELWVNVVSLGIGYIVGHEANLLASAIVKTPVRVHTGYFVVDALIYYVLLSFFLYWNHRFWHAGPFWPLHRFHHASPEMSPINAARQHPLQTALQPVFMIWPLALTGAEPGILFVVGSLHALHQLFTHANLPQTWGWFGRWVLMSPAAHRLHHALDIRYANSNYGALTIWDHLFGTYAEPFDLRVPIGVEDVDPNGRHFLADFARDTLLFAKSLPSSTRLLLRRGAGAPSSVAASIRTEAPQDFRQPF